MDKPKLRRVVTGHTATGRSTLLSDGEIPMVQAPGFLAGAVWSTDRSPASNEGNEDPTTRPPGPQLGGGGTQFSIVTIPPRSPGAVSDHDMTAAKHATATLDYMIVLSGEITLRLEEKETTLGPSDILVQRGTVHSWENRGREPAVLAVILVTADPLPGVPVTH